MRGKLPNAIPDKITNNSGESEDAIGVGNVHPRGHNKAVFTTYWWPDILCAAGDLARKTVGKVEKHTGGKKYWDLLEPLRPKVYNLPLICIKRT